MNFQDKLNFAGGTTLRAVRPSDDDFVLEVFIAARPHLAHAHPDPNVVRLLSKDQFRINRLGARARFPNHREYVIQRMGQDVGSLLLDFGDREWRIVEIAVHPAARGTGIGGDILKGLQAGAARAGTTLSLSTAAGFGSAAAFYARHGFVTLPDADPMPATLHMAWYPPGSTPTFAAGADEGATEA